jgi:hypothetical protein
MDCENVGFLPFRFNILVAGHGAAEDRNPTHRERRGATGVLLQVPRGDLQEGYLSILCGADVAASVFSPAGKAFSLLD